MFFNKKDNSNSDKVSIIILSQEAKERFNKSHYNDKLREENLTEQDIELLFCDKKDWDPKDSTQDYGAFISSIAKITFNFSYIIFPNYSHFGDYDIKGSHFNNCIFYGKIPEITDDYSSNLTFNNCVFNNWYTQDKETIDHKSLSFDNCSFLSEYENRHTRIQALGRIVFKNITSCIPIIIGSCGFFHIEESEIRNLIFKGSSAKRRDILIQNNTFTGKTRPIFISNYTADTVQIYKCEFESLPDFWFSDANIERVEIEGTKINSLNMYGTKINRFSIIEVNIEEKGRIDFDLVDNFYIDSSKVLDIFDSYTYNKNLKLDIVNSKVIGKLRFYKLKSLTISSSQIDDLIIDDSEEIIMKNNTFRNLCLVHSIDDVYIAESAVEEQCNFSFMKTKNTCILNSNTFKNSIDFKFASIHKLAIYQSSFKALDFDCSFINEARFVGVKGIDNDDVVDLTDQHFASKESFEYFKGVLSQS